MHRRGMVVEYSFNLSNVFREEFRAFGANPIPTVVAIWLPDDARVPAILEANVNVAAAREGTTTFYIGHALHLLK